MATGSSTTAPLHVLIVGAGIGGLCLAHGLRQAGIAATVYERERSPMERTQGYRLSINPDGNQALHDCLPTQLFERFAAACSPPMGAYRLVDEDLNDLFVFPRVPVVDPVRRYRDICRAELRRVLLREIEHEVRFDKRFVRYSEAADGTVVASFADGSSASGDLLVGADGARSAVRTQLLPGARQRDSGVVSIAGKVPLSSDLGFHGGHNILDSRGCFMFIADVRSGNADHGRGCRGSYIQWTFAARRQRYRFPALLERMSAAELLDVIREMTDKWHGDIRLLVEASHPSTIQLWRHLQALPIPPWEPGNATLIGDAIHVMPPFAGIGANTALRDSASLCRQLVAAQRRHTPLRAAVAAYEADMRRYGFAAVDASMAEQDRLVPSTRLRRILTKASLRMSYAWQRLRRAELAGQTAR